jgi:hypothetical protein
LSISEGFLYGQHCSFYDLFRVAQGKIIGYKETNRLAQQPGSYTILIYRRPVVRHKGEQTVKRQQHQAMYLMAVMPMFP